MEQPRRHYCYILASGGDKLSTYNGYTVDLKRRIRQHNREIKGGAKATAKRDDWHYIAIVSNPAWTANQALSFEWHVKHPTGHRKRPARFNGVRGRLDSLPLVLDKIHAEHPYDVWIRDDILDALEDTCPLMGCRPRPLSELLQQI